MFPIILETSSIDILSEQYLYHYRSNDTSIMKKVSPEMFSKVELLYEKEMQIANFYKKIYDFTNQITMDFCDLSMNIFIKEYKHDNSFENFEKAKSSRYSRILKKNLKVFRYKKSERVMAIALKSNNAISSLLIQLLKLWNRRN